MYKETGSGTSNAAVERALQRVRMLVKYHTNLGWFKADEVAAIHGTRPFKSIANSSGIAWGGTSIQLAADMGSIVRSSASGRNLLPSQQSWIPPLLEVQAHREATSYQDTAGFLGPAMSEFTVGDPSGSGPYTVTIGDSV